MKSTKIICGLLLSLIGFSSCTDLTEEVYDQLTADEYFKGFTDKDVPGALGKVYNDLKMLYGGFDAHTAGCYLYTNEECSDLWVTPKRGGSWYDGGIYFRCSFPG